MPSANIAGHSNKRFPVTQVLTCDCLLTLMFSRFILRLCAEHANGLLQYDTHNLYGTSMALEHHAALQKVTSKRPFLLTRQAQQQRQQHKLAARGTAKCTLHSIKCNACYRHNGGPAHSCNLRHRELLHCGTLSRFCQQLV